MLMEKWLRGGERVLDLGTGSGILAVCAARLGAKQVTALDIEEDAVAVARETVKLNGVSNVVTVARGSLEMGQDKYDVVVANIFAGVIISLAESLTSVVRSSGLLLTSGIISARSPDVARAVCDAGFELVDQLEQGGWRAFVFRRL